MSFFAWMVYGVAVGLLVSAAAWILDRGLQRAHLPTRWVWAGALALTIGVPLATWIAPGDPGAPGQETASAPAVVPTAPAAAEPDLAGSAGILARASEVLSRPQEWPGLVVAVGGAALAGAGATLNRSIEWGAAMLPTFPGGERAGLAAWAIGSTALAAFLLLSLARLGRRRLAWPLARVRGRRVRIAPELGPAVLGLRRPEIVLPRWATRLEPEELDLVLAHESEHVHARDPLLLAVGLAAVVAFPWNPATWWQLRRLRDAVEVDCDRRVLRGGAPAKPYGSLLVRLGGAGWKDLLPAAPLGGTPSLLERRLNAMKKRSVRTAVPLALLATFAATGLLVLACEADTPTHPAEEADLAEAAAEDEAIDAYRFVAPFPLDDNNQPLFVVDGVIVPEHVIDELDSRRIDNIEVVKGAAAAELYGSRAANGVVMITTEGASAAATGTEDEEARGAPAELTGLVNGATVRARPDDPAETDVRERLPFTVERVERDGTAGEALPRLEVLPAEARYMLRGSGSGADDPAADDPGAADEGVQVILRSPASIDTNEENPPLYVVDGVILSRRNALDLEALDIESVEVVKGAAAAELYGSRAANGVLIISTRR